MPAPLFSIITVTFNAANSLLTTLRSVDQQSFTDYEHLIMDGASTDSTLSLLDANGSPRRRIFSAPDKGIYDAMNKGIGKASGKYLIFLNAGDAFHDAETLAKIANAIVSNNYPGVVYGQTNLVDSEGRFVAPRHLTAPEELTYKSFTEGMVVCHQAFVALADIVPLYNLNYKYSADYDWCIQCLQHSRKNVYVPDVLIDYLFEGVSTQNRQASLMERFKIMSYYYGSVPTIMRHLRFLPRFLAHRKAIKNSQAQQ